MSSAQVTQKQIQTLPTKKKLADTQEGKAWRRNNVDFYGDRNSYMSLVQNDFEYLYKLASGYNNESSYRYLTSPYATSGGGKNRQYQAKLRHYDIITPLLELLMGEKAKRPFNPMVVALNSDLQNVKKEAEREMIQKNLEQIVLNNFNDLIGEDVVPRRPITPQEEIERTVGAIPDEKAITGQKSLDYLRRQLDLDRKFRKGWFDYVVTGFCFSIKDIKFQELFYQIESPVNCGYTASENIDFIEDGEAAWVRRWLTLSDIVNEFHDELDEKTIKELEAREQSETSNNTVYYSNADTADFIKSMSREGKLNVRQPDLTVHHNQFEVLYVNWKSKVKIGILRGTDVFGEPYEHEVTEDFRAAEGETIEWYWVDQVWEGYRIADDYYVKIRPIPFQRGTYNNPSDCKLLINGRTYQSRHYYVKSIVRKLEPYQELYNAIHWHLEKVINKNKEKLVFMPKSLIPDDEDMDMFGMMYHADADGFLFSDEVDSHRLAEMQAVHVLDLSLRDYIAHLQNLLGFIRMEADDVIGFNRQRKGQTQASDGKGVTEQAIFQSAIISENRFLEFDEFQERELQGLLDLAKNAWKDGKKAWYLDSEKRRTLLEVDGGMMQESEFQVFATNGRDEIEALEGAKQIAQAMMQNEGMPSTVAKLLSTKNLHETIRMLEDQEQEMLERQQQQAAAAQQAEQDRLAMEKQMHDEKLEVEMYGHNVKLQAATLNSAAFDQSADNDVSQQELDLKQRQLDIEREKISADLLKNKRDNDTKLKNKVSGEK